MIEKEVIHNSTMLRAYITVRAYIFAGINFRGLQICSAFADFIFADAGNDSTWLTT